ncbi:hypothetical protein RD792_003387 [Penstemon davidsonii]|uniref:Uncharacterized protein n=1 Tax=Penstemon davidsonii TaxID=160366 RepID=A0ABR0DTN6_9LAMI|nr:hypothetical protein RD792_003387 [Penstemon davidsonii]
MAAPTATLPASFSLLPRNRLSKPSSRLVRREIRKSRCHGRRSVVVLAMQDSAGRQKAGPGFDTRIHWENEDEGWIGGRSSGSEKEQAKKEEELLGEKFSDLLNSSTDSYYQ